MRGCVWEGASRTVRPTPLPVKMPVILVLLESSHGFYWWLQVHELLCWPMGASANLLGRMR